VGALERRQAADGNEGDLARDVVWGRGDFGSRMRCIYELARENLALFAARP
jgi:hypothetical protein